MMQDPKKTMRSNLALLLMVILVLLYGIFYRIRSGDTSLYLFGYKIGSPFGTEQSVEDASSSAAPVLEAAKETESDQ